MVISTPESIRLVHQCRFWVRFISLLNLFLKLVTNQNYPIDSKNFNSICQFKKAHHWNVITLNLEADSLCADDQIAETLELTAIMIFTWFFRYSCQYTHFWNLQYFFQNIFIGVQNASLPFFSCFGK